jgi:DNA repair exonuclease SbcCD nuclease subunit
MSNTYPKNTCLAIGDQHFKVKNVLDVEQLIKRVTKLVKQLKPTFVVLLGDLLHNHEKLHVVPFNLATKLITSLARLSKVFLLVGNHDYCNNSQFLTTKHPFNAFKKINNVTVCDRVIIREFSNCKFVFCPYVPPDRFEEALDTVHDKGKSWDDADCIFAHQEFYGCKFNPTTASIDGDVWPDNYPLVVSGHIHNAQKLQDNIYYVGSCMQTAFGESSKKTVAYLTFQKGKEYKMQKIDLELRKKKIVHLETAEAEDYQPPENVHIKLVLTGTSGQNKVFRQSNTYKKLQKLGVIIDTISTDTPKLNTKTKDDTQKSVLDILSDMIKNDDEYVKHAFKELQNI